MNRSTHSFTYIYTLEEEAAGMITIEEGGNIKVASFTKDDIFYDIIVSQEKKEMMSCSCSDQQQSGACYKHMYLVNEFNITGNIN